MIKKSKQPPQYLQFRLVNIQNLPNNQRVALYFCEAVKQYFSFVYGKDGVVSESEISFTEYLKLIEDEIESIDFVNETVLTVSKECVEPIVELLESLEESKRIELENHIQESDENFLEILKYSLKIKKEKELCQSQE